MTSLDQDGAGIGRGDIFYFSGTGNSLAVARDLAARLGARLTPIASLMDSESIRSDADIVGIVYPDYHSSVPLIVRRFAAKLADPGEKYVFAVCTYGGGGPGLSVEYLRRIVQSRGGRLAAGFAVKMPYNYITFSGALAETPPERQRALFDDWARKLDAIGEYVGARAEGHFETSGAQILRLVDLLGVRERIGKPHWLRRAGLQPGRPDLARLSFWEALPLMDGGFRTDAKCVGCGVCAKLCPVGNVELIDGRPSWRRHCEQCFACLNWCPRGAIQFGEHTAGMRRYHHPAVKVADMVRQDED